MNITLRQYLIAHAPAEPQPWFTPVFPPQPQAPEPLPMPTDDELRGADGWEGMPSAEDTQSRTAMFVEQRKQYQQALVAWHESYAKARFVQWPAAWADAVIKAGADR